MYKQQNTHINFVLLEWKLETARTNNLLVFNDHTKGLLPLASNLYLWPLKIQEIKT